MSCKTLVFIQNNSFSLTDVCSIFTGSFSHSAGHTLTSPKCCGLTVLIHDNDLREGENARTGFTSVRFRKTIC
jgi:hypothetical protein